MFMFLDLSEFLFKKEKGFFRCFVFGNPYYLLSLVCVQHVKFITNLFTSVSLLKLHLFLLFYFIFFFEWKSLSLSRIIILCGGFVILSLKWGKLPDG